MIGFENAPRYAELVGRTFGAEDVVPPGIILEADRPEYSYLKGERLFGMAEVVLAGVANTYSKAQLLNPATSRQLVIVEQINALVPSPSMPPWITKYSTAMPALMGAGYCRDTRMVNGRSVALIYEDNTNLNQLLGLAYGHMMSRVTYDGGGGQLYCVWRLPIILAPGVGVCIESWTQQRNLYYDFIWRERAWRQEEIAE